MKTKIFPLYSLLLFFASVYSNVLHAQERSVLNIISPNAATVWKLSDGGSLEWSTQNIGSEKNIRFFLIRDEMVVQELGIFPNTGSATHIKFAKNIGAGNRYKVMGIELFPDDKFKIAKFATPFFSIQKEVKNPPIVSEQAVVAAQSKQVLPENLSKKELRKLKKEERKAKKLADAKKKEEAKRIEKAAAKEKQTTVAVKENTTPEKPKLREEFVGRNITYVNDLVFEGTEISVYIWDHGRQDGDIVSIYLNGEPVLSKYYLTYWKKEIKIKVDPNKPNDLFLYAHNLGSAPPNTVSLKITDGTITSEDIILNSDLKSCEAVSISVNK
ncbi:hypothetical protein CLV91_0547 [Maribacter vaceletii]|uniref:Uncharacterized protein n=1 Tax=Maribacter vaceletii TaxID=1206816 RepID=A0A495EC79_9FLAO|nr:hypothetical protein [Maribacter vaceletii]RKR14470.1 hypothetical protein CLV91_0547 [Maribacter vaceletii]